MVDHPLRRLTILAAGILVAVSTSARAQRLPANVLPDHYDLGFTVDLERARFEGVETIQVRVTESTSTVVLNAVEIAFHDVTITAGGSQQKATVSLDADRQTATLTVPEALRVGTASIHIRYTGALNDQLRGFYLSTYNERRFAVTQFESTDARRAFPSFDEPALKATFAVTLVVNKTDAAISNGRILSSRPGPGASQQTVKFATTPKMSTYLVAMAVGPFECLSGAADGTPIRVCATPEKRELGHLALTSAEQILKFYNNYFAIKYPFGKLDVVAVPDFAAGAMENTAAIFYREADLLADSRSASVATRKNIASVLAHEMAHQWFGDLVTMQWWDDLWLNEGFATWMANTPLAALHPDWNIAVDEAQETQQALNLDSLKSTRPIQAKVETPAEIEEVFDAIAYQKGAAVLRMVENYVGSESFRKGVNTYLEAHAYGNATSADFWTAIAAASGKPVDRMLPTFVRQPGSPLIDVALNCDDNKTVATLSQSRFYLDPALGETGTSDRWQIPVCLKTDGSGGACDVLAEASRKLTIGSRGCASWLFANAGAKGYYRTAYPHDSLRALAPRVQDVLSPAERLSLLGDEWALVSAGRHSVADYLTIAPGFATEHTDGVLASLTARLDFIHEYLANDTTRPKLEAFTRSLLRSLFDEIGFAAKPSDTDEHRQLRATLIDALGTIASDPDVVAQSRAALEHALQGAAPLDPTVARAVILVAARHGDATLYDQLSAAARLSVSPEDHDRYLFALPQFRDPALIDRGLKYALSPDLRRQDTAIYLAGFFFNDAARLPAWTFVKQRWSELAPKITISGGDVNFVSALSAFCDSGTRDDVKAFFTEHTLATSNRALNQTIERINNCLALREAQAPVLERYFSQ
jgi:aminopeptidase N